MRIELNVDADAFVQYTNKLEKLPKTAFPNAVRETLNGLAFDVKQNTMPAESDRNFTIRQRNFFKANSRVEIARGNNVNSMESMVGFVPFGGSNQSVEDLEKQEHGGIIGGRSFIPTDFSRTGKSPERLVSRRHRLGAIKNVVRTENAKGKTPAQKFVKSVVHAGAGGHVLHDDMLFRVDRLQRAGNNWKFKLTPVYSFKKGRNVRVSATHFMENAVNKTAKGMEQLYFKKAERQLKKYLQ